MESAANAEDEGANALLGELKEVFRRYESQPATRVIEQINPILRGWVNYFRIGNSSQCFGYVKDWVEKKTRVEQVSTPVPWLRCPQTPGFDSLRWTLQWLPKSRNPA